MSPQNRHDPSRGPLSALAAILTISSLCGYGAIKPISTGDIRFDFRQGQLERIGPGSILYNVKAKK
jgi:hypothetical protein